MTEGYLQLSVETDKKGKDFIDTKPPKLESLWWKREFIYRQKKFIRGIQIYHNKIDVLVGVSDYYIVTVIARSGLRSGGNLEIWWSSSLYCS